MRKTIKAFVVVFGLVAMFISSGFTQARLNREYANYKIEYAKILEEEFESNFSQNITLSKLFESGHLSQAIPLEDGSDMIFTTIIKKAVYEGKTADYLLYVHLKGINQETREKVDKDFYKIRVTFKFDEMSEMATLIYIRIDDLTTGNISEYRAIPGDVKSTAKCLMLFTQFAPYIFDMDAINKL